MDVVERQGKIVVVGGIGGTMSMGMEAILYETWVTTSIMGSRSNVAAVIDHTQRGNIECHIEEVSLEDANSALDRLRTGKMTGRPVLKPA